MGVLSTAVVSSSRVTRVIRGRHWKLKDEVFLGQNWVNKEGLFWTA